MRARHPNSLQRLLHRLVSIRLLVSFFAKHMHRIDMFALNLTRGRFALSELAGWTIILLTTTGAKTGNNRTIPLLAGVEKDRIAVAASSFGRKHNPAWYYNLKANPPCVVTYKNETYIFMAREVEGDEYDKYWTLISSNYVGYEKYKMSASPRHIPIMILESKN